jgi:hypothetical protein
MCKRKLDSCIASQIQGMLKDRTKTMPVTSIAEAAAVSRRTVSKIKRCPAEPFFLNLLRDTNGFRFHMYAYDRDLLKRKGADRFNDDTSITTDLLGEKYGFYPVTARVPMGADGWEAHLPCWSGVEPRHGAEAAEQALRRAGQPVCSVAACRAVAARNECVHCASRSTQF